MATDPIIVEFTPIEVLTKREYFAALAMHGFCANPDPQVCTSTPAKLAQWAVGMADALIEALNKDA